MDPFGEAAPTFLKNSLIETATTFAPYKTFIARARSSRLQQPQREGWEAATTASSSSSAGGGKGEEDNLSFEATLKVMIALQETENVKSALSPAVKLARHGGRETGSALSAKATYKKKKILTQPEKDRVLNGKNLDSGILAVCATKLKTLSEVERLANRFHPLQIAAYNGDLETLRLLIQHGAKVETPDDSGVTVFHVLAFHGDWEIISALTEGLQRSEVVLLTQNKCTTLSQTPLLMATRLNYPDTAIELLKLGADPNARDTHGSVALHFAVRRRNIGTIKELIEHGADPNAKDFSGSSCLHLAAKNSFLEATLELVKAGADPSTKDSKGAIPLHYCTRAELVEPLITPRAKVSAEDERGRTPLHRCAKEGNAGCIEALLEKGADVIHPSQASDQPTPLHCASLANNLAAAKALLAHGADPRLKIGSGPSPLDVAKTAQMKQVLLGRESTKNAVLVAENLQLTKQLEEQQKQNQLLSQQMAEQSRQMADQQRMMAGLMKLVSDIGARQIAQDGFELPDPGVIDDNFKMAPSVATDDTSAQSTVERAMTAGGHSAYSVRTARIDGGNADNIASASSGLFLQHSQPQQERMATGTMDQDFKE